jgi:hypothetical protein
VLIATLPLGSGRAAPVLLAHDPFGTYKRDIKPLSDSTSRPVPVNCLNDPDPQVFR